MPIGDSTTTEPCRSYGEPGVVTVVSDVMAIVAGGFEPAQAVPRSRACAMSFFIRPCTSARSGLSFSACSSAW